MINRLIRLLLRWRYPVSLPEDIASDLGIRSSNLLTFSEFTRQLCSLSYRPERLLRFMPRNEAEAAFELAQRKEIFGKSSLFSYYFHEGWLEFNLHFDDNARLRRIYMQHKSFKSDIGIEIPLDQSVKVKF